MNNIEELRKKLIKTAKKKIAEKYTGRDQHIIRAVALLDDLDSVTNLLTEHVREWYNLHFPEIDRLLNDNDKLLKVIYFVGDRQKFDEKGLKDIVTDETKIRELLAKAKDSAGGETQGEDLAEIKLLALNALNLREERQSLTKYLEKTMQQLCPNLAEIAGPVIGSRLISKAGSLKGLAFMPSSTIQLLGAEKALFSHLKMGTKSPKYGYLFGHQLVRAAKKYDKGKIARTLAGKIAIAARKDYFGKGMIANELKKELDERVKSLGADKR